MILKKDTSDNKLDKHGKKINVDYMIQKFSDPTKKFAGVERYGQFCHTHKDPQWVPDNKNNLKWSEKGLSKKQREAVGYQGNPREHPMLTLDKHLTNNPPVAYKNLYFPAGVMSNSKNLKSAHQIAC